MSVVIDKGKRQSGKSTRALLWALGDPGKRVIVCPNESTKSLYEDLLQRMGHPRDYVRTLTWHDYTVRRLAGYGSLEVWIDEIGMCLPGTVVGVSGL